MVAADCRANCLFFCRGSTFRRRSVPKAKALPKAHRHAGTAGYLRLHQRSRTAHPRETDRASAAGESVSAPNRTTPYYECGWPPGARTATNRQTHRHWSGRRFLAGVAPDDRRPVALETPRSKVGGPQQSGNVRFSERLSCTYRSWHEAPRIVACPRGGGGIAFRRPRWNRNIFERSQFVSWRAHCGKPHAQTSAHRSAHREWHWQRVFG